jgi:spoIIIJ-associated protein
MMNPSQILKDISTLMGFDVSVDVSEDDERILVNVSGEEADALVGRKGQTLDALQYLVSKIINKDGGAEKQVVVDCEGYRQRRVEALEQLALQLGEKATQTGRVVAVNPMSAHDRRVIHMTLRDNPAVSTRSEGDGDNRRLLIVPE